MRLPSSLMFHDTTLDSRSLERAPAEERQQRERDQESGASAFGSGSRMELVVARRGGGEDERVGEKTWLTASNMVVTR
jgi:hypothetical protein